MVVAFTVLQVGNVLEKGSSICVSRMGSFCYYDMFRDLLL